jgi:hypothetical protein
VADAVASWPLTIGNITYWARPVSAAFALRALPDLHDPARAGAVLHATLRQAFPRPRWRWWRDPLRQIARLSPTVQGQIIAQCFARPGVSEKEQDPMEALFAAHRKLARPDAAAHGPSLALMALTCEVRLGAGWWYAPHQWPTVDGYAPLASVWAAYEGLEALDAQALLVAAKAARFGQRTDPGVSKDFGTMVKAAYPHDPTVRGTH